MLNNTNDSEFAFIVSPISQHTDQVNTKLTNTLHPNDREELMISAIENHNICDVEEVKMQNAYGSSPQTEMNADILTSADDIENNSDFDRKRNLVNVFDVAENKQHISEECLTNNSESYDAKPDSIVDSFVGEGTESVGSTTTASITTAILRTGEVVPLKSSTESLRQLSLQLSGLVNHAPE
ncbi:unnamed protein product, partial [Meganyctiphanes norvegica]